MKREECINDSAFQQYHNRPWTCRCQTLQKIKDKTSNYVLQLNELQQRFSEDDIFWIWTRETGHAMWPVINIRIEKVTHGMGISLDEFRLLFAVLHCCQKYLQIRRGQQAIATMDQFTDIVKRHLDLQSNDVFDSYQIDSDTLESTLAVCMNAYNKYFS